MTRSERRTRSLLSITAAGSLLFLAACGSDSDGAESASSDAPVATASPAATELPAETDAPAHTAAPTDTEAPADSAAPVETEAATFDIDAACAAWIDADNAVSAFQFTGQGDADSVNAAIDAAIDAADPANLQTLTDLKEAAQPLLQDPEADGGEDAFALYADAVGWASESCPDIEVFDVTALDYHYEGIPETLETGYKVINFSNEGTEAHEMFAFRINDGVTETVEELVELPEEEVMTKITPVNAVFAMPGGSDVVSWNLAEPGNYAALCFVSVGSVGETEGEGPPHFTQGMIHEFTVT